MVKITFMIINFVITSINYSLPLVVWNVWSWIRARRRKCQVEEQDTLGLEAEMKGASEEVLKHQIDVDIHL